MRKRIIYCITVLLFVSLPGCAAKKPFFSAVPQGKSTTSSTQFQLIDDFNAGVGRTRLGQDWKTPEIKEGNVALKAERGDAIKHGGSLNVKYEFTAPGALRLETNLKGLDISQAKHLILMIRTKELAEFKGELKFGLTDLAGRKAAVSLKNAHKRKWIGPTDLWTEVGIPTKAFQEVDFGQLAQFDIEIGAKQPAAGNLVFDEITFFGAENLIYNSDADNIKELPTIVVHEERRKELLNLKDEQFLREIARDSWKYFENLIDKKTGFVVDHVRLGESPGLGSYISPTNLALYWMAYVAAYDLSLISKEEAIRNIELSFSSFEKLEIWQRSFWYNFYHTGHSKVTRRYVSTVDNGWLAAGLIIVRQAFPEQFGDRASKILRRLNFIEFYDVSNGQLKLGYDDDKKIFAPYHYGLLATEARLISYIAIGKGDLEPDHWTKVFRTLPPEWDWQKQTPEGKESKLFGVPVFEGHYTYLGKKFVPSWGGSLFEFLAPTLVMKEQELAKEGLGKNNIVATDLHIKHALEEKKYGIWGMAPCAVRNGKYWIYREYGIPQMGAKGYPDRGIITPYASFLALATRPKEAIKNFRQMLKRYPDIYGEYGFYDSVDAVRGIVNYQYLALDQAMSFLAIANYLEDQVVRRRFHSDPIGKQGEKLFQEQFSIEH